MTKVNMRGLLLAGTVLCAGVMPFDASAKGASGIWRPIIAVRGAIKVAVGGVLGLGAGLCAHFAYISLHTGICMAMSIDTTSAAYQFDLINNNYDLKSRLLKTALSDGGSYGSVAVVSGSIAYYLIRNGICDFQQLRTSETQYELCSAEDQQPVTPKAA